MFAARGKVLAALHGSPSHVDDGVAVALFERGVGRRGVVSLVYDACTRLEPTGDDGIKIVTAKLTSWRFAVSIRAGR